MAEPTKLPSIGERIYALRIQCDPRLTQEELAHRAEVSVSLISKLEQGVKQTVLLTTLHKIARALDVNVSALLAYPARINTGAEGGEGVQEGGAERDDRGVIAIRRAIIGSRTATSATAGSDDAEPAAVDELRRSARYAWHAYWANRFDVLGGLLPGLIATTQATTRQTSEPEVFAVSSEIFCVAASMLTLLGYVDLGYHTMTLAAGAADRSGEQLRRAAISGYLSWVLLHQTGAFDQATALAVAEADQVEPRLSGASPAHIAIWSGLLVSGAVAAARDNQIGEADDMLNLAEAASTRLDAADPGWPSRLPLAVIQPLGMPQVIMQQVDVAVVTGRPARALEIARRMPPDADLLLAARARHLADVASAQTSLGRDGDAVETLLEIERRAPHWMRYQPYPRTIVRELLEHEKRVRTPGLRGLARRLNVA